MQTDVYTKVTARTATTIPARRALSLIPQGRFTNFYSERLYV